MPPPPHPPLPTHRRKHTTRGHPRHRTRHPHARTPPPPHHARLPPAPTHRPHHACGRRGPRERVPVVPGGASSAWPRLSLARLHLCHLGAALPAAARSAWPRPQAPPSRPRPPGSAIAPYGPQTLLPGRAAPALGPGVRHRQSQELRLWSASRTSARSGLGPGDRPHAPRVAAGVPAFSFLPISPGRGASPGRGSVPSVAHAGSAFSHRGRKGLGALPAAGAMLRVIVCWSEGWVTFGHDSAARTSRNRPGAPKPSAQGVLISLKGSSLGLNIVGSLQAELSNTLLNLIPNKSQGPAVLITLRPL